MGSCHGSRRTIVSQIWIKFSCLFIYLFILTWLLNVIFVYCLFDTLRIVLLGARIYLILECKELLILFSLLFWKSLFMSTCCKFYFKIKMLFK